MNLARGREYTATERSIDVQVSRLRRLLEQDPAQPVICRPSGVWAMCSCRTVTANEESEQHVLPHALVLAAVLVVYQFVSYATFYNYLLAPTVKQISHLLANQVKLIFPVESNQLALSEDAEALVYVATGSDIYTQTEAEQHGLNESKPYTYLEESISRELGARPRSGSRSGSLHHLDPAAPGQQGVGAHPADRDRG